MAAATPADLGRFVDELLTLPVEVQRTFVAGLPAQRQAMLRRELRNRMRSVYVTDPGRWVHEALGEVLWSAQVDIGRLLVENKRVAVPSAVSMGKSFFAARLAVWWIDAHPPGTAFVVTTATTGSQVKAILWREIGRAVGHLRKRGRFIRSNQTELRIPVDDSDPDNTEELVAFGRKPSDYDPSAFQGIHAPHVLLIIDEAGGVPESLFLAGERITVSDSSRVLAIGNPTNSSSHFARICRPGSGWAVRAISAFESPNFTDEHLTLPADICQQLQTTAWAEDQRTMYGETSPQYVAGVLGQFPTSGSVLSVVPWDALRRATDAPLDVDVTKPVRLGVDVGGGGDSTVVREVEPTVGGGWKLGRRWAAQTPESEQVRDLVVAAVGEVVEGGRQVDVVNVDSVGIGWAVVGWLQQDGVNAVGINAGSSPLDDRFLNVRAEMWWVCGRELLEGGLLDLGGANDALVDELADPHWTRTAAGKIQVEAKDKVRKRLGRSPDDADAMLLALYHGSGESLYVPVEALRGMGRTSF